MSTRPALRPYQERAIGWLRRGVSVGHLRQVLVAPTGAGKSVIAHDIVASAAEKGKRIAFVVNRVQLVQQFSRRLAAAGIAHGILRGEESRMTWHPVLVASIQTIARRGVDFPVDVIVIDEAHGVPGSKDYRRLLRDHPEAVVLGLTATPWAKGMGRDDSALGGPLFQNSVVAAQYDELLADGHLVDCDVFAPGLPDMKGVKIIRNQFGEQDYADTDVGKAMNKPKLIGDIVSHWMRLAQGTPTVVFACDIKHSMAIVEAFCRAGVAAEHIDCYCDDDERQAILRRVDSGETTVISCAALLAEGWDQPSIRTMILARPTKSQIRYVQMVGRVLRPFQGKAKALLLDHSGTVHTLGFPTDNRDYTLDGHKPVQREVPPNVAKDQPCIRCGWLETPMPNPCPNCGYEKRASSRPVVAQAGELEQVKRSKATLADKQKFYSEVLGYARARGKQRGWVAHTYRRKFDVWPKGMAEVALPPSAETLGYIRHLNIAYARSKQRETAHA